MKGPELMDRIRDEMAAAKNDYIATLGELMTEYLRLHPEAEIAEGKSLKGAFDAMREAARKKQKGGCYAMPPAEVFGELLKYYGLSQADADFGACMAAVIGQTVPDAPMPQAKPVPAPEKPKDDLAELLDLDTLLGV